MQQLNLPPYNANIKKTGGTVKIFDILRRKFVALTPEEWVRQNFVHYLQEHKGYSPLFMMNEVKLELNGMSKRCDSLVYDRQGKPLMIVEYKAPHIALNQAVFDQITRYNIVLGVDYLIISNGITHYCIKINEQKNGYTFLTDVPNYADLT